MHKSMLCRLAWVGFILASPNLLASPNIGASPSESLHASSMRMTALLQGVDDSQLKEQLSQCQGGYFAVSDFTIAHRGAPLGYPEHSREGYAAAAAMGAGAIECDVTFTQDLELVCRHSQCDLATTTNILNTPLATKCAKPFQGADGQRDASARCCTSDLSLQEFKSLCARPDRSNPRARSIEEFLVPLDSPVIEIPISCGTVMTHGESIRQIETLGRNFIPELKRAQVTMPFVDGFDEQRYAQKLLQEYVQMGIDPQRVLPQSFDLDVVFYWIDYFPQFADQVVWLHGQARLPGFESSLDDMRQLYDRGLRIIAPPISALIGLDDKGQLIATPYAQHARAAGLDIVTWTFESGDAVAPDNKFYAPIKSFMTHPGKMLEVLAVLAREVRVRGVFTDWPGTVTYYKNCSEGTAP